MDFIGIFWFGIFLFFILLTSYKNRPTVNGYLHRLESLDENDRKNAANSLVARGSKAVNPLIRVMLMSRKKAETRAMAAEILGRIGDNAAIDPLLTALHDREIVVRQAAAMALGHLGDARAIAALCQQLHDSSISVRCNSLSALAEFRHLGQNPDILQAVEDALYDPSWDVKTRATEVLRQFGIKPPLSSDARTSSEPAPLSVKAWLARSNDADWKVRWKVIEALAGGTDPRILPALIQALEDTDWSVRLKALEALKHTPGPINAVSILPLLTDAHLDVRDAATELLIQLGATGIDDVLPLLQHADVGLRERAARILAQIKDERLVEPLMTALRDPDMGVRQQATNGLKQLGNLAVEYLLAVVNHHDGDVQWRAVQALGEIGNPKAIAALVPILRDDDEDVRAKTAHVLTNLGWTPDTDEDRLWLNLAQQAWDQIPAFEAQAIPPLIQLATDRDRLVRQAAIRLLTQMLASIDTVVFGSGTDDDYPESTTLRNVDISALELALPALRQLVVCVETYDFQQVERFLTYAVNQVGQVHLKQSVTVVVHGPADRLHPNLRNAFANLCQSVRFLP